MTNEQAYSKAAALCARMEQCSAHIRKKLEQWEAPDADAVIERLKEERYIDDARFARAFAHDKLRYNQWGRLKISAALRQKGIDSADIQEGIDGLDEEEYANILDNVLARKRRELERREDNEYILQQKVARHAASHGFEMSLIFDRM